MQPRPIITARAVIANTRKLGCTIPDAIDAADERATRFTEAAGHIGAPDGELIDAFLAAVDTGKDPAADKNVQRALTADRLANENLRAAIDHHAAVLIIDALIDHAQHLFDEWHTITNRASTALTDAHAVLGDTDLDDTKAVVRLGGRAADAWANATNAVATIDRLNLVWQQWAEVTRRAPSNAAYSNLRFADIEPGDWRTHQLDGRVAPWTIIRIGYTLDLADPDEMRRRIDTHRAHDAAEEAARLARTRTGVRSG
ncbi:hypothetical protein F8M49_25020 [Rhodococcus zopfii]|uniref:Uncharacterized protein n=1 Tax=Rhodococcus zopfii TaxID=43772 RepID=A0ABU3WV06_9NOCA|nr:hypothetical protein [Rhodococcus zopfii]